jgi:hypothetical protein
MGEGVVGHAIVPVGIFNKNHVPITPLVPEVEPP